MLRIFFYMILDSGSSHDAGGASSYMNAPREKHELASSIILNTCAGRFGAFSS